MYADRGVARGGGGAWEPGTEGVVGTYRLESGSGKGVGEGEGEAGAGKQNFTRISETNFSGAFARRRQRASLISDVNY